MAGTGGGGGGGAGAVKEQDVHKGECRKPRRSFMPPSGGAPPHTNRAVGPAGGGGTSPKRGPVRPLSPCPIGTTGSPPAARSTRRDGLPPPSVPVRPPLTAQTQQFPFVTYYRTTREGAFASGYAPHSPPPAVVTAGPDAAASVAKQGGSGSVCMRVGRLGGRPPDTEA